MLPLRIDTLTFGLASENTYVLSTANGKACIVDPGCSSAQEEEQLLQLIHNLGCTPTLCLCTHRHFDHVHGCHFVNQVWGLTPLLSDIEINTMPSLQEQLQWFGLPSTSPAPEPEYQPLCAPYDSLSWEGYTLYPLLVPGHSPGHLVFHIPQAQLVLAGDTLFAGGIGRTDLWGGNHHDLVTHIHNVLFRLPPNTVVYSGHGPSTTIGEEIRTNPFLK